MNFMKQYVDIYNKKKELIKAHLIIIEDALDKLVVCKEVKSISELKEFEKNIFILNYRTIETSIAVIVKELEVLQSFCYEDIKKIIPLIPVLSELNEKEAFAEAKNIDWLIETINEDKTIDLKTKKRLLEISQFNKKIRYFIHSTLAFVENPLPFALFRKIQRSIKKDVLINKWEEAYLDISYHQSEVYRIRKSLEQFYILSNVEYGNWDSIDIQTSDIEKYLSIYVQRFFNYCIGEDYYKVNVIIENSINPPEKLHVPFEKIKEVLDVLLHNAAEELIEKYKESIFDMQIICTLEIVDEKVQIIVTDNGRGIAEDNKIFSAFISTKKSHKNSGIGLDIATKNALILQGELTSVNNEVGASFIFSFPTFVNVNQEGFRKKLNILQVDFSEIAKNKIKELEKEFGAVNVIKASEFTDIKEFEKDGMIDFINIIVCQKNNSIASYLEGKGFKGDTVKI